MCKKNNQSKEQEEKEQGERRKEMQPKRDEKSREIRVQRKGMTSRETSGLIGPSPGGEAVSATIGPRIVYLIWLVSELNIDN